MCNPRINFPDFLFFFRTPNGDLPLFVHRSTNFRTSDFSDLVSHLEGQKFSADHSLEKKKLSERTAMANLVETHLRPACIHTLWVDQQNREELVRPWFSRKMPFPVQMGLLNKRRRRFQPYLLVSAGFPWMGQSIPFPCRTPLSRGCRGRRAFRL